MAKMTDLDPKLYAALEDVRRRLDAIQREHEGFRYMLGIFDKGVMGATGNIPPQMAHFFVETYELSHRKECS